jgi:hypothetical protein
LVSSPLLVFWFLQHMLKNLNQPPGLAAAGAGVGAVGSFVFSTNPSVFVFDAAIDKTLSGIGSVFQIPALITTTISEGVKNSPEISTLKNSQPMGK